MTDWRDDLGRGVRLIAPPQRIVSLCPSQTETLFALGLGERIAGVTRYCVHPGTEIAGKTQVGGTKQLDFDAIARLQPDLIIAEKEENRREDVERLAGRWPVFVTDVGDFASALRMIETLGKLCDRAEQGSALAGEIAARWRALQPLARPLRTLYLIWRKPFMAAGAGSYIDDVLQRCGLRNVVRQARYPELANAQLPGLNPELVLLSSEPYPFRDKHLAELRALLPRARIELVDGEMFSWYGVRMRRAADYLEEFIGRLTA